jgi:hypothetical protein
MEEDSMGTDLSHPKRCTQNHPGGGQCIRISDGEHWEHEHLDGAGRTWSTFKPYERPPAPVPLTAAELIAKLSEVPGDYAVYLEAGYGEFCDAVEGFYRDDKTKEITINGRSWETDTNR